MAICYDPNNNQFTGSVTATILLQQIRFRYQSQGRAFYKFAQPCDNTETYKKGDSWTEELGFGIRQFTQARASIATKTTSTKFRENFAEIAETHTTDGQLKPVHELCYYWRDRNNMTWFWFNENLYQCYLAEYGNQAHSTMKQPTRNETDCKTPTEQNVQSPISENTIIKNNKDISKESSINTRDSLVSDPPQADDDDFYSQELIEFSQFLGDKIPTTEQKQEIIQLRQEIPRAEFTATLDRCITNKANSWRYLVIALRKTKISCTSLDRWHDPRESIDTLTEHENRWQAQPPEQDTEYIRLLEQANEHNARVLARMQERIGA